MTVRKNDPFDPSIPDAQGRNVHPSRVLGTIFVVVVVVLPVLFSQGFEQWTSIPTTSPFAAATGYRIVTLPTNGGPLVELDSIALHSNRAQNLGRVDQSNVLPAVQPTPGVISLDLQNGTMVPGATPAALNSTCCYSENTFSPDGETVHWTGTEGNGWSTYFVMEANGTVNKLRIDITSVNDWTGDIEAILSGFVNLTSSTDSNETVVYANTFTDTGTWNEQVSRTSDDVFQNRHPGLAVDAEAMDLYLAYTYNTGLNLLKYDVNGGQVLWELFNIVPLGVPPDTTFNYFQVVEDNGHVAVLAPRNNDTVIWYAEDAGGVSPPTATQAFTMTLAPPGDHQGFTINDRMATLVRPDPDLSGTEIRYVLFNPDPAIPPNEFVIVDDTYTGTWYNLGPNYSVRLENPNDPSSAVVWDISGNEIYVATGNAITDTMNYGTVPRPVFFDGFESNGTYFWNP